MKILIDTGHPAHVHYYKHFSWIMQKKGHEVFFTTIDKEFEPVLLKSYGFNFKVFGRHKKTLAGKILGLMIYNLKLLKYSIKIKPDIYLGAGSLSASHVAFLMGKPFIQLEDTGNWEQIWIYLPFTKLVLTPDVLKETMKKKQIRYNGYQEICYLHPNYFIPDKKIFQYLGLEPGTPYCVIRFIPWDATHDIGNKGLTMDEKREILTLISKRMKLFISSEAPIPEEFEKDRIKIPPDKMHDALAFAHLFVGEGATMASEAGLLGTPSLYINSSPRCYTEDQESFGTVYNFRDGSGVKEKIEEILNTPDYKEVWRGKRFKLIESKIDVTAMLVWFVENFPESQRIAREDPDWQEPFMWKSAKVEG